MEAVAKVSLFKSSLEAETTHHQLTIIHSSTRFPAAINSTQSWEFYLHSCRLLAPSCLLPDLLHMLMYRYRKKSIYALCWKKNFLISTPLFKNVQVRCSCVEWKHLQAFLPLNLAPIHPVNTTYTPHFKIKATK